MNNEEYKHRLEAEIEAANNHDYWSIARSGDSKIGAMRDRWLDPPEEVDQPEESEHHPDCPVNSNRPWRPYKCICEQLKSEGDYAAGND